MAGRLFRKRWTLADSKRSIEFHAAAADKAGITDHGGELEITLKQKRIRRCDGKPIIASEHQEQAALISWWWLVHQKYGLPPFALFAVPNGGARDVITGSLLKAEGVRKGALDLILAKPTARYHGLFIEMKIGDNKPSDDQKAFIAYLESAGYKTAVHWNAASAIKEIENYLEHSNG